MADSTSRGKALLTMVSRIGLGVATIILSVNLWTGFPILALWVGSQAADGDPLAMTGIGVTLVTLITLSWIGMKALSRISASYDRVTNRPAAVRQPAPWLLSMSAATVQPERGRRAVSAIEMIVIGTVVAAFILFEIWFFLLSSRPI
ncbi:MAG: hypothetical protein WAK93_00525 [Solirubrobacteraceae bacterium]